MKRFFFVLAIFSGLAADAGAYSPTDFTDVFTNPRLMSYCSQSSSVNGVAGVSGVCTGGLFYYTEMISGFRDQNNPDDPKRLCQKDTSCSPVPQAMYLSGSYTSINPSDGKVPSLFRIYIPPGTTGINMSLYVPQVRVAAVVRMGQPPINPNKPISEYGNIQSTGLLVNDVMNGGDFWTRNVDGLISIFYGGGNIDQSLLQLKAFSDRWLYVQVVNYDGGWLQKLNFSMTIGDMTAYRNWYNSVNWDCYNNPGDAAKCSVIPSVPSYTVNFTADTGGTVSRTSQPVSQGGSTSEVTATPNSGYQFVNWTGADGFTSTNNPITISNISGNMMITANFQTVPLAQPAILDIFCLEIQGSYYKTSLKAYTPSDMEKKEQNFSDSQGISFWEMTDWIKADTTTPCGKWDDSKYNFTFPGKGDFEFHRDAGSDDFFGFYWKQTP